MNTKSNSHSHHTSKGVRVRMTFLASSVKKSYELLERWRTGRPISLSMTGICLLTAVVNLRIFKLRSKNNVPKQRK